MRTWNLPKVHPTTDGPWAAEPDKAQWIDEATDLDCLAKRNQFGTWCGYAGVPPGHPWWGTLYDERLTDLECAPDDIISVHGGLTYSDLCDEEAGICHVPDIGRPANVWWFGFDCAHAGDFMPIAETYPVYGMRLSNSGRYWTLDDVRTETTSLASQLHAVPDHRRKLDPGSARR